MFASIRRHRLARGSMDELMHRVDESFAEQIAAQEGFVCYHAIDLATVSWSPSACSTTRARPRRHASSPSAGPAAELPDMDLQRLETVRSEIDVSRASAQELLEPLHAASGSEFCSLRRYVLRDGSIDELLRRVDESFAETVQTSTGSGGTWSSSWATTSSSRSRSRVTGRAPSPRTRWRRSFVREELADFDLERIDARAGDVRVSRALAQVLVPEHA